MQQLFILIQLYSMYSGGWRKCAGWSPLWMCGASLIGATVGIVGMGSIGMAVAKRPYYSRLYYSHIQHVAHL